ncbi:MAG: hypothetical protein K0S46_491 [Moraxellaceae bacterium]|jgi:hypothetical protein|nr:hypothetical protein [Moraxellaceae bacterium]
MRSNTVKLVSAKADLLCRLSAQHGRSPRKIDKLFASKQQ